jgi:hypothetical protein
MERTGIQLTGYHIGEKQVVLNWPNLCLYYLTNPIWEGVD